MNKLVFAIGLSVSVCPLFGQFFSQQFAAQSATGKTAALVTCSTPREACASMHTIDLRPTGSPVTCTYKLEGSTRPSTEALTDADFFDLSGDIDCSAAIMVHVVNKLVRSVRGNLTALSGGTNPAVTLRYVGQPR